MSQVVEVSLRLPVRPHRDNSAPHPLEGQGELRFIKQTELATIPKPGDIFTMSAAGLTFPCKVTQAAWHDSRNIFVIACQYGGRTRLSADDYHTIMHAPDWTAKTLL